MIFHILSLLINIFASLVAGTALLRAYLQYHYIPLSTRSGNPFAPIVFALTNWIVLPMRRIIPSLGRLDTSSVLASLVVVAFKTIAFSLMGLMSSLPIVIAIDTGFEFLSLILSCLSSLLLAYVVLSWVQRDSPLFDLLSRMVIPILAPIRQRIRTLGGMDWSVLVLFLLLQIANIVLVDVHSSLVELTWNTV
jgi:YggT family protein